MNDLFDKLQTQAPQPDSHFAQQLEDRLVAELAQLNVAAQGDSEMLAQTTLAKPQRPVIHRAFASPLMLAAALLIVAAAAWVFGPLRWPGNSSIALGPTQSPLPAYPTITPENANRLQPVGTLGNGGVFQAAYSPDGATLALAGATGIWLYDTADLNSRSRLLMTESPTTALAYSPDGTIIASGHANGEIHLWNALSGAAVELSAAQTMLMQTGHRDRVNALAFSPDGTALASSSGSGDTYSENAVQLWDLARGAQLWADRQWSFPVWSVAFSPDGQTLAVDSGNTVNLRAAFDDGSEGYRTIEREQPQPAAPDSLFLSESVLVFNDGTTLRFTAFDNSGETLNLADDGTVEIGTTEPGNAFFAHVSTIAADNDGAAVVVGTTSGGVYLVDVETREVTTLREPDGTQTMSVAISSGGQVAATFNTGEVSLYDLASGEAVGQLDDFDLIISKVMAYGDNALMTVGAGSGVRLWMLDTQTQSAAFRVDNGQILESAISPDGAYFAYIGAGAPATYQTYLRDIESGEEVSLGGAEMSGLAFSPDSQHVATVSEKFRLYIASAHTGTVDHVLEEDLSSRAFSPTFSPDGERLAIGRNGSLQIVDVQEGRIQDTFMTTGDDRTVARLWYSPDGRQLLATVHPTDATQLGSSSTTLLLLNADTGEVTHELAPQPTEDAWKYQRTWQAVFSPDGAIIAGLTTDVSGESRIDLWDTATGERLETPGLDNVEVTSLSFNTEGNLLITGGWDGLIHLYAVTD